MGMDYMYDVCRVKEGIVYARPGWGLVINTNTYF